jgi:magnesium chelatase subunit D
MDEPGETDLISEEAAPIVIAPPQAVAVKAARSEKQRAHTARLNAHRAVEAKIKSDARRLAGIEARGRARYAKLKVLYGDEAQQPPPEVDEEPPPPPPPPPEPEQYYYRQPPRLQYAPVHTTINFV